MLPDMGKTGQIHASHNEKDIAGVFTQRAKTGYDKDPRQCSPVQVPLNQNYIGKRNQADQSHVNKGRPQGW